MENKPENNQTERMRTVKGYEGLYTVTDLGRVYTCRKRKFLRAGLNSWGYLTVNLWSDGKVKSVKVHKLVAEAFLGIKTSRRNQVNHKDGDKTNNRLSNIEVVTGSENVRHARDTLGKIGEQKLSRQQAIEIKKLALRGQLRQREIAEMYDVSPENISLIKLGKGWSDITQLELEACNI